MANYKSQKEIIAEIASNLEKLESKKLSIGELEAHVDLVRELFERTIVLRYKIFEEKSAPAVEISKDEAKNSVSLSNLVEDKIVPKAEIEQKEVKTPEPAKKHEIIADLPTIDFSVFDDPIAEPINETTEEKIAEIKEEVKIERVIVEKKSEPIIERVVEKVAENTSTTANNLEEIAASKSKSKSGIAKKFDTISHEMKGQFGFSKLDTLVGAFGLNERLQFINELFDGSSEQFSEAIKEFDKLQNENDAKGCCAKFASQHNWDEESETVDEFIQKICRRYA